MRRPPRVAVGLAVSLLALTLSACQGSLDSTVRLKSSTSAQAGVQFVASGELAKAILSDPALDQRLFETVSDLTEQPGKRTVDGDKIIYAAGFDAFNPPAGLLGFESLVSGELPDGGLSARVHLTTPKKLVDAIVAGTKNQKDAKAEAIAWQNALTVKLEVCAPGAFTGSDNAGVITSSSGCAVVKSSLTDWPTNLEVTMRFDAKRFPVVPTAAVVALVLGFSAYYFWRARRSRTGPTQRLR